MEIIYGVFFFVFCTVNVCSVAKVVSSATVAVEPSCPAACGVCPPAGIDGACCHGNMRCEEGIFDEFFCLP